MSTTLQRDDRHQITDRYALRTVSECHHLAGKFMPEYVARALAERRICHDL
jgi:hypothetical protein